MRNIPALMIVLGLLLLSSGCRAPAPPGDLQGAPAAALVWPKPPAEPRIRYERSSSGPDEYGIKRSFLRRMLDTLVGRGEEHFVRPTGVAEHEGVLYVADPGARALWILDTVRDEFIKVNQVREEALGSPVAVAVRPDGAVFVADTLLKKVFLLDREGKLVRIAAEKGLVRPAGLAYDAATQRLYVVDSAAHQISAYGADGALIRTWGRGGHQDGEFNHPTHLALDGTGTLMVTDALNFRIQAFDQEGRFLWKLGRAGDGSGDFSAPKGLAADSEGHIYVVDALFDAVQIFERDGTLLLAFGERGTQAGQFWLPGGIFITPQDKIYVADAYNRRIHVLAFVRTQAGRPNE
jgi:DNA-binding beta-propeller fold protein YncE